MIAQWARAGLSDAFRTLDHVLLVIIGALMALGVVFAMAASPAATARVDMADSFHFALRHALFAAFGVVVLLGAASPPPIAVRRISVFLAIISLALVAAAGFAAPDVKGASRWIDLGPATVQPSELLKPAIVVVCAWMLAEHVKRASFPGHWIAVVLFASAMMLLVAQPDVGQAALLGFVLGGMLLLAGVSWRWLTGWIVLGALAGLLIYNVMPHARARIDAFVNDSDSYQASHAFGAIAAGGVLGRGPGEGAVKRLLPDTHSDFIYAVAAEEFGLFASIGLLFLYGWFVWRGLSRASRLMDPFAQLAAAGLVALIGVQAAFHIAVNLGLAPVKGITLPFVSYGGSSMIGVCVTAGFALALLRDRPGAYLYEGRQR